MNDSNSKSLIKILKNYKTSSKFLIIISNEVNTKTYLKKLNRSIGSYSIILIF